MITRRGLLVVAAAGLTAPAVLRSRAAAAELNLKLRHYLPASSALHEEVLLPWAANVQDRSNDRVAIQVLPSLLVGGPPPQLMQMLLEGAIDLVALPFAAAAGRFPRLEVFEQPFIAARSAEVNAQAVQDFAARHAGADAPDLQVLAAWAQDRGVIHAGKAVPTLAELKGVRLRSPNRLCSLALQALGGVGVSIAGADVPEALAQTVIDGVVSAWEAAPRLYELTGFHTEVAGSPTLTTSGALLAMTKARFDALPEELRRVLAETSGPALARQAGQAFDRRSAAVEAEARARGNVHVEVPEQEKALWIETVRPVTAAWLEEMKRRGIDGAPLIEEARRLLAQHGGPPVAPPPPPAAAATVPLQAGAAPPLPVGSFGPPAPAAASPPAPISAAPSTP